MIFMVASTVGCGPFLWTLIKGTSTRQVLVVRSNFCYNKPENPFQNYDLAATLIHNWEVHDKT